MEARAAGEWLYCQFDFFYKNIYFFYEKPKTKQPALRDMLGHLYGLYSHKGIALDQSAREDSLSYCKNPIISPVGYMSPLPYSKCIEINLICYDVLKLYWKPVNAKRILIGNAIQ